MSTQWNCHRDVDVYTPPYRAEWGGLNKAMLSFIRRNYWFERFCKEHLQRSIRRVLSVWTEFTVPYGVTLGPYLNPDCIKREFEAVLHQTGSKPYDH